MRPARRFPAINAHPVMSATRGSRPGLRPHARPVRRSSSAASPYSLRHGHRGVSGCADTVGVMCGRYSVSVPTGGPDERVRDRRRVRRRCPSRTTTWRRPSPCRRSSSVVRVRGSTPSPDEVRRRLAPLVWGLVPSWAKDASIGSRMINARVETVAEKPAFRKAFATRRCLLPADGFYEWYAGEPVPPPTGRGKPKRSSSRSSSTAPTAGCWSWPGSTRSGATRPRTARTTRPGCAPAR